MDKKNKKFTNLTPGQRFINLLIILLFNFLLLAVFIVVFIVIDVILLLVGVPEESVVDISKYIVYGLLFLYAVFPRKRKSKKEKEENYKIL